jgi:hypothetical protein
MNKLLWMGILTLSSLNINAAEIEEEKERCFMEHQNLSPPMNANNNHTINELDIEIDPQYIIYNEESTRNKSAEPQAIHSAEPQPIKSSPNVITGYNYRRGEGLPYYEWY